MKFQRLFRDDIKAGVFLNKMLNKFSIADYRKSKCYYLGDPIEIAVAFSSFRTMQNGCCAEMSIATNNFFFTRTKIKQLLALFFENTSYNNIRLEAFIPIWNKQAIRLVELAGFTREGELRQVANDGNRYLYSILKQEYVNLYVSNLQRTESTTST
jgi:hypothetical protein